MASMLSYFKAGFEILSEIAPEIDAIKVEHEALAQKATGGSESV